MLAEITNIAIYDALAHIHTEEIRNLTSLTKFCFPLRATYLQTPSSKRVKIVKAHTSRGILRYEVRTERVGIYDPHKYRVRDIDIDTWERRKGFFSSLLFDLAGSAGIVVVMTRDLFCSFLAFQFATVSPVNEEERKSIIHQKSFFITHR